MVDALAAAARAFAAALDRGDTWPQALRRAVHAAEHGAIATAKLRARLGRSSYLGDRVMGATRPRRARGGAVAGGGQRRADDGYGGGGRCTPRRSAAYASGSRSLISRRVRRR